jgi:hypothetical protein
MDRRSAKLRQFVVCFNAVTKTTRDNFLCLGRNILVCDWFKTQLRQTCHSCFPPFRTPPPERYKCAPCSTPSSPPRFPASQVRLPPLLCSAEGWNAAGTAVGFAAASCGGRRMGFSDRAWARPARRCFFLNDRVCCAGIGLLLSSALPDQITQTPPTSSMATSAALNRGPASSIIMYIFPYAIVTVALSRLAGPSPLAPRPCNPGTGHPGPVDLAHGARRARAVCRIDHAR